MMRAIIILVALMLFPAANAASSLSASFGSYDTSVSKGSQFKVSVTVTMPSDSNGTVDVTITPKTGLSCSECSQQLTFDTSGSKEAYFTISADIAGTYEGPFTLKATSTAATSATATATSSVVVSEVSLMDWSFYNTSAPIKDGDVWQLPVKLEITTFDVPLTGVNVTIDESTFTSNLQGVTVGPQYYYVGDVPANSQLTFNWIITVTGWSDATGQGTVRYNEGSTPVYFSTSYTVPDSSTPSTPSTGGGGGGGATKTTVMVNATGQGGKAVATLSSVSKGSTGKVSIPDSVGVPFSELLIKMSNKVTNVQLNIHMLAEKPGNISKNIDGLTYSYIQIDESNILPTDIDGVIISFKVPVSWIEESNVDRAAITLNRYVDDKWTALVTTKSSESSDYVYYQANSSGLSLFGISGQVQTVTTTIETTTTTVTTTLPKAVATTTTVPHNVPMTTVPPKVDNSPIGRVLIVLAILIIAGAAYYFYQQKK